LRDDISPGEKRGLPAGYNLTTEDKVGKLYDAMRGDIEGAPGIFEQLRRLEAANRDLVLRIKVIGAVALAALLINNPAAAELFRLITGLAK
jgi:hypothetical protein